MAAGIIPETTASAHFVELADSQGRLVLLPRATVDALLSAGQTTVELTISLTTEPPRPWLTVTEAARLHLNDVDGITLEVAQAKVSRACRESKIVSVGEGTRRRIDPVSLDAWRLAERERNLTIEDDRCRRTGAR